MFSSLVTLTSNSSLQSKGSPEYLKPFTAVACLQRMSVTLWSNALLFFYASQPSTLSSLGESTKMQVKDGHASMLFSAIYEMSRVGEGMSYSQANAAFCLYKQ